MGEWTPPLFDPNDSEKPSDKKSESKPSKPSRPSLEWLNTDSQVKVSQEASVDLGPPQVPFSLPESLLVGARQENKEHSKEVDDDTETDEDDDEEARPVYTSPKEKAATDTSAELRTENSVEAAIFDRQATDANLEGIMHQEQPGEPLRPLPQYERREYTAPAVPDPESVNQPASQSSSGGNTPPPQPPPKGFAFSGSPNQGPGFNSLPSQHSSNWNAAPSSAYAPNSPAFAPATERVKSSEKSGIKRELVAAFILGYALKAYLAHRKQERYQRVSEKKIQAQDEQITQLQSEHSKLREKVSAQSQAEAYRHPRAEQVKANQPKFEQPGKLPTVEKLPSIKELGQEQLFDQEGNEITLQPGWRVERSAGGYSVVVNEHNRVVHEAIHYGEAYQHDKKREQVRDDMFVDTGGSGQPTGTLDEVKPLAPAIDSGQVNFSHELGPGKVKQIDMQHRLPKPRSPLSGVITSPWLWTAIAFLFIVYFIAALV